MSDIYNLYREAGSPLGEDLRSNAPYWAATEITTLRQKLEQAEARCAELHQAAYPLYSWCAEHLTYQQFKEAYNYGHYLGMLIERHNPAVGAIILRKQAEAVEEFGSIAAEGGLDEEGESNTDFTHGDVQVAADKYGQRLRQQADELEQEAGQ